MITPGDIAPRRDSDHDLYVAVLSNAIHLAADVITCPFVPTAPISWSWPAPRRKSLDASASTVPQVRLLRPRRAHHPVVAEVVKTIHRIDTGPRW